MADCPSAFAVVIVAGLLVLLRVVPSHPLSFSLDWEMESVLFQFCLLICGRGSCACTLSFVPITKVSQCCIYLRHRRRLLRLLFRLLLFFFIILILII